MMVTENEQSLEGFSIGLSGAVPERSAWTVPALDRAILEFVSTFSALVLRHGGRIVHGAHPTFTPVIVRQARRHTRAQTPKPVTLVMSELWAKTMDHDEAMRYQEVAELLVTKQVGVGDPEDVKTRNNSLALMRTHLLQQMNALVVVGGKLHEQSSIVPGVFEEVRLATTRGMATFLIGGLGGMTAQVAKEYTRALRLRNGLQPAQNARLQTTSDIAFCVSTVLSHLLTHREFAERKLVRLDVNDADCVAYSAPK
jgi:hypothetical protein